MNSIYLMRHGPQQKTKRPAGGVWDAKASLSPEGVIVLRTMIDANLAGMKFAIYGSSPLLRAIQTTEIVMQSLVGKTKNIEEFDELGADEKTYREWDWFNDLKKIVPNPTPRDCFVYKPKFIRQCGERINSRIQEVLGRLRYGEAALLVSHNPLIEIGVAAATGQWPPTLNVERSGIVRLSYGDTIPSVVTTYLPPP